MDVPEVLLMPKQKTRDVPMACSPTSDYQPSPQEESVQSQNVVRDEKQTQESTKTQVSKSQMKKVRRAKKGGKKTIEIGDPTTIIANILSKTNFRVANLSQIVDEKFEECSLELRESIKDVTYESTVGNVTDGFSDFVTSVLPDKFKGYVNGNPSSIMSLPCLYERPQQNRWKEKRLKAKEATKAKKAKKTNSSNSNNQDNKNKISKDSNKKAV